MIGIVSSYESIKELRMELVFHVTCNFAFWGDLHEFSILGSQWPNVAESKKQDIVKSKRKCPWCTSAHLVAYIITEEITALLKLRNDNSSTLHHNVCPLRANLISDI